MDLDTRETRGFLTLHAQGRLFSPRCYPAGEIILDEREDFGEIFGERESRS